MPMPKDPAERDVYLDGLAGVKEVLADYRAEQAEAKAARASAMALGVDELLRMRLGLKREDVTGGLVFGPRGEIKRTFAGIPVPDAATPEGWLEYAGRYLWQELTRVTEPDAQLELAIRFREYATSHGTQLEQANWRRFYAHVDAEARRNQQQFG